MVYPLRSKVHERPAVAGRGSDHRQLSALADMTPGAFWLDGSDRPEPASTLTRTTTADLLIVGGGYTGGRRRRLAAGPPEPLRWAGIQLTRWSLNRADRNGGKRNGWLRTLDALGIGFDS